MVISEKSGAARSWRLSWVGLVTLIPLVYFIARRKAVPQFSVASTKLSRQDIDSLVSLGLTPKDPVVIVDELTNEVKTIHGRFLHITDIHPDPFYKEGSRQDEQCHSGNGDAGKYGDAVLGCDSPFALMNGTLQWIKDNLADKIDFIVWTGDNIRHDNDRRYPRTEANIFDMNQYVSDRIYELFGTLPVPSLGNNDVYPHNLFAPGPTLQTREMFKIWKPFIPQAQLHIFNRGAYFFQEIIPNKLAVLSINTLYLFQSNPLVDNCDRKKEPGYKLFEWLGYVLREMRQRNMKVWLSGHVPPNTKNYDSLCLRKYIIWSYEYRDVIVGGLYGHMNIDHFIPLDAVEAYKSVQEAFGPQAIEDDFIRTHLDDVQEVFDRQNMTYATNLDRLVNGFEHGFDALSIRNDFQVAGGVPNNKVAYMEGLRETLYAAVKGKKKSGEHSQRYSVVHVTASIVPTFNSGLRVWEYNITGLDSIANHHRPWSDFFAEIDELVEQQDLYEDLDFSTFKRDKTLPPKMPKGLPLGPAYVPQTFTPERYVQYYADLRAINKGEKEFAFEQEYATDDKYYQMKSLVVDEWIGLARKLGLPVKGAAEAAIELAAEEVEDVAATGKHKKKKGKKKKGKKGKDLDKLEEVWSQFLKHSFIDSDYENMGYG